VGGPKDDFQNTRPPARPPARPPSFPPSFPSLPFPPAFAPGTAGLPPGSAVGRARFWPAPTAPPPARAFARRGISDLGAGVGCGSGCSWRVGRYGRRKGRRSDRPPACGSPKGSPPCPRGREPGNEEEVGEEVGVGGRRAPSWAVPWWGYRWDVVLPKTSREGEVAGTMVFHEGEGEGCAGREEGEAR